MILATNPITMYPIPPGFHLIPTNLLDLRPDSEIDQDILHPKPVTNEKNIWFFWHTGYTTMHPDAQRNIRVWHRRFSLQCWSIRILDRLLSSPVNVSNFLNTSDPLTFPRASLMVRSVATARLSTPQTSFSGHFSSSTMECMRMLG